MQPTRYFQATRDLDLNSDLDWVCITPFFRPPLPFSLHRGRKRLVSFFIFRLSFFLFPLHLRSLFTDETTNEHCHRKWIILSYIPLSSRPRIPFQLHLLDSFLQLLLVSVEVTKMADPDAKATILCPSVDSLLSPLPDIFSFCHFSDLQTDAFFLP